MPCRLMLTSANVYVSPQRLLNFFPLFCQRTSQLYPLWKELLQQQYVSIFWRLLVYCWQVTSCLFLYVRCFATFKPPIAPPSKFLRLWFLSPYSSMVEFYLYYQAGQTMPSTPFLLLWTILLKVTVKQIFLSSIVYCSFCYK